MITNYEKACRISQALVDNFFPSLDDYEFSEIVKIIEDELDDIDIVDDRNHIGFP
jgi:hypothetical protein